jgi:undecaprenyl pyrophosphate synthase
MNKLLQYTPRRAEKPLCASLGLWPSRILVIPDGHRRYAHKTGIGYKEAYILGAMVAANVACEVASNRLVPHLTFFPLATKNFEERDEETLAFIFTAINTFLDTIARSSADLQLSIRGQLTRLPPSLANRLRTLCRNPTSDGAPHMELQLLIDYDGHRELADMTKNEMNTALAHPFDIVIRTGGAFRLSGAPVLECSSADMFSLPMTFPEFTFRDLDGVVQNFIADKKRRLLLRSSHEVRLFTNEVYI